MGFFDDMLRFISVMILGMEDRTKAFRQEMEMGERYIRWGEERGDLRDFESALHHLEICRNEDAGRPDLILRKQAALLQALVGLMRVQVERLRAQEAQMRSEVTELEDGLRGTRDEAEAAGHRVQSLEREGRMIRAREAREQLEELQRARDRLAEQVQEEKTRLKQELAELVAEARQGLAQRRDRLELAIAELDGVEDVSPEARQNITGGARREADELEQQLAVFGE